MYKKTGLFLCMIATFVLVIGCFSGCSKEKETQTEPTAEQVTTGAPQPTATLENTPVTTLQKTLEPTVNPTIVPTEEPTTKPTVKPTVKPTEKATPKATQTPEVTVTWEKAYTNYIKAQDPEEWKGYALIYIDKDNVPELVAVGNSEAQGNKIINYYKGKTYETQLSRLYFSYIEKGNLLNNSEGNMDEYYDIIYSIKDGKMTKVAEGHYGAEDNSNLQFDEDGNPIYVYEWNGKSVSEDEYNKELNAVYDTSKATDAYTTYSTKEILKKLQ